VLATLPGEQHEIGLLVTALMAASEGLDCVYLGTDIPVSDMVDAVMATQASCVGLSCVTRVPHCDVVGALTDLCRRLPQGCSVWLGGCSAVDLDGTVLPPGCVCLNGHEELRTHARALAMSAVVAQPR
jgi:cobalamin-dependent methionine synthase I